MIPLRCHGGGNESTVKRANNAESVSSSDGSSERFEHHLRTKSMARASAWSAEEAPTIGKASAATRRPVESRMIPPPPAPLRPKEASIFILSLPDGGRNQDIARGCLKRGGAKQRTKPALISVRSLEFVLRS